MPQNLHVIALISGGKDSFFSVLHCLHHGHKVVALANLCPPSQVDDMDSMTYQTVGHSIIPLYGECTGIPVFQQPILGTTVCDHQDYSPPMSIDDGPLDETEDLFNLLSAVRKAVPEANAVSTGAILSTYQRTRVESVVIRLGMIPLAYLWQYPFLPPPLERDDSSTGLLDDMRAAGCDARLIKIASFGIPSTLLGESLSSPRTTTMLAKGLQRILVGDDVELRAAVLGEGGEYETLTVDGPRSLWKRRLVWAAQTSTQDSDVHYATFENPTTVPRDPDENVTEDRLRIPATFDRQFLSARAVLQYNGGPSRERADFAASMAGVNISEAPAPAASRTVHYSLAKSTDHISISNITAAPETAPFDDEPSLHETDSAKSALSSYSAGDQMQLVTKVVSTMLRELSISLGRADTNQFLTAQDITSTTLLLSSIDDFVEVNIHYGKLFSYINPPARVTIATDLSPGVKVSLNMVVDLKPRSTRRPLHVQSRSYWAPANIGPYSQAIAEPLYSAKLDDDDANYQSSQSAELTSFAGQIPLVPVTMELAHSSSPLTDTLLSLQHLWRVAQERKVDFWTWGIAFMPRSSITAVFEQAMRAYGVWREVHRTSTRARAMLPTNEDETEEEDIWDLTHNKARHTNPTSKKQPSPQGDEHIHILPNWDVFRSPNNNNNNQIIPPFIAAEVVQLPRNASIEWWSTGLGRLPRGPREANLVLTSPISHKADGAIMYSTLTYGPTEHGKAAQRHHFTSIVLKRLDRPPDPSVVCRAIEDILSNHHDDPSVVTTTRLVSGHCLIAAPEVEVGGESRAGRQGDLYETVSSKPWMRGIAVIPCRRLWAAVGAMAVAPTRGGTSPSLSPPPPVDLVQASMALLVRTEEKE